MTSLGRALIAIGGAGLAAGLVAMVGFPWFIGAFGLSDVPLVLTYLRG